MKSHLALVTLVACSAGSLMSMEEGKKGRLNFELDNEYCIVGYSKQNLEFLVQPPAFLGRSILNVVPLNEKDRNAMAVALSESVTKQKTVKVPYTLQDKEKKNINFMAAITALKKPTKEIYSLRGIDTQVYIIDENIKHNYFVKVTQVNNNNQ